MSNLDQELQAVELLKPVASAIPGAGPFVVGILELAEVMIAHVAEEYRAGLIEAFKQTCRMTSHTAVQAFLDSEFPKG